MDKKQVTDLRSELLDSRFGAKSISTIAESKRFPLHEMRDDVAFQIITDELYLDGNARQNLATFCQTWDDENVHKLMDLSINKNWIDKEEYPQSAAIDLRCVNMVADLWHAPAPKNGQAVGTKKKLDRQRRISAIRSHRPALRKYGCRSVACACAEKWSGRWHQHHWFFRGLYARRDGDEMALAQAYGSCRQTNG